MIEVKRQRRAELLPSIVRLKQDAHQSPYTKRPLASRRLDRRAANRRARAARKINRKINRRTAA